MALSGVQENQIMLVAQKIVLQYQRRAQMQQILVSTIILAIMPPQHSFARRLCSIKILNGLEGMVSILSILKTSP